MFLRTFVSILIFLDVVPGAETAEDLGVEIVVGEVEVGRDLEVEGEAGPDPEIEREMRGSRRRRRKAGELSLLRKPRMEPLMQSRLKEILLMELTVWRWPRRKNPVLRVALAGGPGVETAVAPGPVTDAGQDPDPGRDPSDPDRGREGGGLAVGTDGKAEAAPNGPSPEITRARRAREIAGLRRRKTRSPVSREIMIKKKLDTRIRRTRSTKLSTWRYRILPKYFIYLSWSQF